MQVKYFQTEHGINTNGYLQAIRYDTYEEAEAEALKVKVTAPFTTVRIYEQRIVELAAVTAKVERAVIVHEEPR